jgi:hypothetical protein
MRVLKKSIKKAKFGSKSGNFERITDYLAIFPLKTG